MIFRFFIAATLFFRRFIFFICRLFFATSLIRCRHADLFFADARYATLSRLLMPYAMFHASSLDIYATLIFTFFFFEILSPLPTDIFRRYAFFFDAADYISITTIAVTGGTLPPTTYITSLLLAAATMPLPIFRWLLIRR